MGTSIYPVPYSGIQETIVNAKGDLIVATANDAVSRLAVGTDNYVLTADSAEATGLKWAAGGGGGGGGKVLQVVSTTLSTTYTAGLSGSFIDIAGLSLNITPATSGSRILLFWTVSLYNDPVSNLGFINLVRNSTAIAQGTASGARTVATAGQNVNQTYAPFPSLAGQFLDSPGTTSTINYKIQMFATGGTLYVNRSATDNDESNRPRTPSTITAMEIGV
jgi:hypothetical protein